MKKGLNINNNYFNKSGHNLKTLCDKIYNFEFNFNEVSLINKQIDDSAFKDKLLLINNNSNIDNMYNSLKNNIKRYNKLYYDLLTMENFYKLFFENTEKNNIETIVEEMKTQLSTKINVKSLTDMEIFIIKDQKCEISQKYKNLINSRFFLGLFNLYKFKNCSDDELVIFNNCIKDFCELEILNNWNDNNGIDKIPNLAVISDEISRIIKENPNDKKKCELLIKNELDIIKNIYKNEKTKPIMTLFEAGMKNVLKNIINKEKGIINEEEKQNEEKIDIKDNNIQDIKEEKNNMNNNIINGGYAIGNNNVVENLIYLPFLDSLSKVLNSIKLLIYP